MTYLPQSLGVAGNVLQLLGAVLTLYGLFSATSTPSQRLRLIVTALWRGEPSAVAAELSTLNPEKPARILQGLAFIALGYCVALASQVWVIFTLQS